MTRIYGEREEGCSSGEEVGVETYADATKYMQWSRHQNAGRNRDINIANRSYENVPQIKYLGTAVTDQNLIKRGLNSGNAYNHSRLLSKKLKLEYTRS
jgi:hypothetical protein